MCGTPPPSIGRVWLVRRDQIHVASISLWSSASSPNRPELTCRIVQAKCSCSKQHSHCRPFLHSSSRPRTALSKWSEQPRSRYTSPHSRSSRRPMRRCTFTRSRARTTSCARTISRMPRWMSSRSGVSCPETGDGRREPGDGRGWCISRSWASLSILSTTCPLPKHELSVLVLTLQSS